MTEAMQNLSRPDVRSPFILIVIHNLLFVTSGQIAITFYAVGIFQSDDGIGLDQNLASVIVAINFVTGGILGIFAVQKLPRVRLSLVSMTLMSICMGVLGGALYTTSLSPQLQNIIKVTSVTAFIFSCSAGKSLVSYSRQ